VPAAIRTTRRGAQARGSTICPGEMPIAIGAHLLWLLALGTSRRPRRQPPVAAEPALSVLDEAARRGARSPIGVPSRLRRLERKSTLEGERPLLRRPALVAVGASREPPKLLEVLRVARPPRGRRAPPGGGRASARDGGIRIRIGRLRLIRMGAGCWEWDYLLQMFFTCCRLLASAPRCGCANFANSYASLLALSFSLHT
jgi:hypothetical protein